MKKLFCFFLVLVILGLSINGKAYSDQYDAFRTKAENVLFRYVKMLREGNASRLLSIYSGKSLKKRERLLRNNPEYKNFLKKNFANANFLINRIEYVDDKFAALDVSIIIDEQERKRSRIILSIDHGKWKIFSEEEIIPK